MFMKEKKIRLMQEILGEHIEEDIQRDIRRETKRKSTTIMKKYNDPSNRCRAYIKVKEKEIVKDSY